MTKMITILTFCENCGRHRDVALVKVGRWFIWYCFPCLFRHIAKQVWQNLKLEFHYRRAESRIAREDR